MQKRRKLNRQAFTYAEILMAVIVLAVAIVPLMGQFYIGFQGNKTGKDVTIASNLASGLIDEIRSKAFEDPDSNRKFGPEPDEDTANRIEWDDVDDYIELIAQTPPETIDGQFMNGTGGQPDFSIFRYDVVVESVEPTDTPPSDPPPIGWRLYNNKTQATSLKANYKRVIVSVSKTDNSITPITLTTIRARY